MDLQVSTNTTNIFDDVKNHMFSNQNIAEWLSFDKQQKQKEKMQKTNNIKSSQIFKNNTLDAKDANHATPLFYPDEKDTLFWCFYIAKNGILDYKLNKINSFKIENDMKIKAVELLREKNAILKEKKIKLTPIEANLITKQYIDVKCLQALCIAYEVSIKYVSNKCYYDFFYGDSHIVLVENHSLHKTKCSIQYDVSKEELAKINKKYWHIENVSKPILGQSNYTLSALQDICNKLSIPIKGSNGKRYVRKKLYDAIVATIS